MEQIVHKVKTYFIVFLACLTTFFYIKSKILSKRLDKQIENNVILSKQKLDKDVKKKIIIYRDRMKVLWREKEGSDGVKIIEKYIPPEGKIEIIEKKQEDNKISNSTHTIISNIAIMVKDKGFCFNPGVGILYAGELYPELDIKFLFWYRYGIKAGLTKDFVDIGISRRLDDILPFRNTEGQIVLGKGWKEGWYAGVGLRCSF